jgi:serine/threonine-protein kinase
VNGTAEGLTPGDQVGPYRIEAFLGEGAMGQVFRARAGDGEPVALKVIRGTLARDAEHRRRFEREARTACSVSHRHLVAVVDSGDDEGRGYLAMELMSGMTLGDRLREGGALATAGVVRLVAELGGALDALHAAGLVHRDVKPSNIMFDTAGVARLTDFGLAKGAAYTALTRQGQMVGTLAYLAPEIIRGEEAGPAADVYALGCVAYECLSTQPPFPGTGLLQVGMAILNSDPPDLRERRPDVSPAFLEAVGYALAKTPKGRPPTATAYARMLAVSAAAER